MTTTYILDPFHAVQIIMIATGIALGFIMILYSLAGSRRIRCTSVYLSGEGEDVVSQLTPSIASLYWGFVKRFARSLYRSLIETVHTGSLHDWFRFISSWLSILILIAIIVYLALILMR